MTDETKPTLAMKSKEEIINELIEAIKPLKIESPTKKHEKFVNVGIEAVIRLFNDNKAVIEQSIEVYATQQTAELQQEVERLKSERDGERLQVERLMIENGVMFKALQKIESLYWEQEPLGDIYIVASKALNPQQDENGR